MTIWERAAVGRQPDFDFDAEVGHQGELVAARAIESLQGGSVEVKTDLHAQKTGNVFIEFECRFGGVYQPSGIATSLADLWAFVLSTEVLVITPTDRLRALARYYYGLGRVRDGGLAGDHPTRGVLVPVDRLLAGLMNGGKP